MLDSPMPHPVESAHWHPVAALADVQAQPVAVQLLDQSLVLWRDEAGAVHAWADQCPHRGARLSLGRVCAGRLECPYHGWQFAPSGQCVRVPALPDFVPPAGHAARVFAVQVWCELVWVCLQPGALGSSGTQNDLESSAVPAVQALPQFEAEADARLRKINCGPYDVATSAPRIVALALKKGWAQKHHENVNYSRLANKNLKQLTPEHLANLRAARRRSAQNALHTLHSIHQSLCKVLSFRQGLYDVEPPELCAAPESEGRARTTPDHHRSRVERRRRRRADPRTGFGGVQLARAQVSSTHAALASAGSSQRRATRRPRPSPCVEVR